MIVAGLLSSLRRFAVPGSTDPQDARRGRVVAVIECILNQNARDRGAARFPALNEAVLRLCADHQAGIVQIPCPEMQCLGFQRRRPPGASIRQALDAPAGRECCRQLGQRIADRLLEYTDNGVRVLAVLGGNAQSPGCAVIAEATGLSAASGVLMRELERALRERNLAIPFRGIRDAEPDRLREDLRWLKDRLEGSPC